MWLITRSALWRISNTPGSQYRQSLENGQWAIQQADGVLITRHPDGALRYTPLYTNDQLVAAAAAGAAEAVADKASLGGIVGPDLDWPIPSGAVHVVIPALATSRTWSLPDVGGYPRGQDLVIVDEGRFLGGAPTLTVVPLAGSGDAITGYPAGIPLSDAGASVRLRRGGSLTCELLSDASHFSPRPLTLGVDRHRPRRRPHSCDAGRPKYPRPMLRLRQQRPARAVRASGQTWTRVLRPTDPGDNLTAVPSAGAAVNTLGRSIFEALRGSTFLLRPFLSDLTCAQDQTAN
ncbi:hypothetical protein [Methylobacterium currus]|uniref:hypothetical protein n=1 Tax=Methylobacterium currus TaxID=2051553 RepID=UPI000F50928B|nr:hypothetical protein [Methylobacterium currus]